MDVDMENLMETNQLMDEAAVITEWLDLPPEIWIEVMQNLKLENLKNLEQTCKTLHEIAANHIPTKLKLSFQNAKYLKIVPVPLRIYKGLEISDQFLNPEFDDMIERILIKTGAFITELTFTFAYQSLSRPAAIGKMLNMVPNLKHLDLNRLDWGNDGSDLYDGDIIKLPKLKSIKIESCPANIEDLILNHLEWKFAVKEMSIQSDNIVKFLPLLQDQQQTIEKLKIEGRNSSADLLQVFSNLPNLHLKHFEFSGWNCFLDAREERFLNFLRQHDDLKYLKLYNTIKSDDLLNVICDTFGNLETFDFGNNSNEFSGHITAESTFNFHKLKKLKVLMLCLPYEPFNLLNGLTHVVNKNLVKLKANFDNVTKKFLRKLPHFIPNLEKLRILDNFQHNVDIFKPFKKLERLDVGADWQLLYSYHSAPSLRNRQAKRFVSKLKILQFNGRSWPFTPENAMKIVMDFPELEYLYIFYPSEVTDSSLEILLSGLKNLRHLRISHDNNKPSQFTSNVVGILKTHFKYSLNVIIDGINCDKEFAEKELEGFPEMIVSSENSKVKIFLGYRNWISYYNF